MDKYQYSPDLNLVVADIDSNTTHAGKKLSELPAVLPAFFVDHAVPDVDNPANGPDELCVEVPISATPPAITVVDGTSTLTLEPLQFVGHPIRRPH